MNPSPILVLLASFPTENEISVIMPSGCLSASMFWTCFLSNWQRDWGSKRIKCLWNSLKSTAGSKTEIQTSTLAKGKVGRTQPFYMLLANVSHHMCSSGLTRADGASCLVRLRAYGWCSEWYGWGKERKRQDTPVGKQVSLGPQNNAFNNELPLIHITVQLLQFLRALQRCGSVSHGEGWQAITASSLPHPNLSLWAPITSTA